MFMEICRRRSPSTRYSRSKTSRRRATSVLVRSRPRVSGDTSVWPRIFWLVASPMPKMYVNATSTRLSRGRSTPAIRAKVWLLLSSALPLLVLGILLTDHPHDPFALDDLTLLTHLFYRRSHFHIATLQVFGVGYWVFGLRSVPNTPYP